VLGQWTNSQNKVYGQAIGSAVGEALWRGTADVLTGGVRSMPGCEAGDKETSGRKQILKELKALNFRS